MWEPEVISEEDKQRTMRTLLPYLTPDLFFTKSKEEKTLFAKETPIEKEKEDILKDISKILPSDISDYILYKSGHGRTISKQTQEETQRYYFENECQATPNSREIYNYLLESSLPIRTVIIVEKEKHIRFFTTHVVLKDSTENVVADNAVAVSGVESAFQIRKNQDLVTGGLQEIIAEKNRLYWESNGADEFTRVNYNSFSNSLLLPRDVYEVYQRRSLCRRIENYAALQTMKYYQELKKILNLVECACLFILCLRSFEKDTSLKLEPINIYHYSNSFNEGSREQKQEVVDELYTLLEKRLVRVFF